MKVSALSILAGVLAMIAGGIVPGIWTAVIACCLLIQGWLQNESRLHQSSTDLELIVIAAGATLPALLGASPLFAVQVAAVWVVLSFAEWRGAHASWLEWALPGLLSGIPVLWAGRIALVVPGWTAFVGLAILIALSSRVSRIHAAILVLASCVGGGGALWLELGLEPRFEPIWALPSPWIWCLPLLFGVLAVTWWILGQQFTIMPWLHFFAIGLTAALLATDPDHLEASYAMLAFLGLGAASAVRLSSFFMESRTKAAST